MALARRNVLHGLENVVDVTGVQTECPGGLAQPKEGHVRQQIVAHSELIKMLDAAPPAPVQKIAQPLGIRPHRLGVFEEGFLGKEFLDLIHHPLATGVAILLDRYATAHSVKRSLPALHGFDRRFEIHSDGFVFHP